MSFQPSTQLLIGSCIPPIKPKLSSIAPRSALSQFSQSTCKTNTRSDLVFHPRNQLSLIFHLALSHISHSTNLTRLSVISRLRPEKSTLSNLSSSSQSVLAFHLRNELSPRFHPALNAISPFSWRTNTLSALTWP